MSRDITKLTKWLCAQRRLRSAWASTQYDQSSLYTQWVAKNPSFLHADSEDPDQTERTPRLIWVFAGRTLILLVLSCRGSYTDGQKIPIRKFNSNFFVICYALFMIRCNGTFVHVKLTLYARVHAAACSYANWTLCCGDANVKLSSAFSFLFMKIFHVFSCPVYSMNIKLWKSCENCLCFECKNQTFFFKVTSSTSCENCLCFECKNQTFFFKVMSSTYVISSLALRTNFENNELVIFPQHTGMRLLPVHAVSAHQIC